MLSFKLTLVLALTIALSTAAKVKYTGHRLIRLDVSNQKQADLVSQWEMDDNEFDIWARHRLPTELVDVSLSPKSFAKYAILFSMNGIKFTILQKDLQTLFDEEERLMVEARANKANFNIIGKYATYPEIQNFINDMVIENPTIASSYVAGKSVLGNDLKVIVIKSPTSQKSIWIDCGIHAREWVSPASCMWMINSFIEEYKANDPQTVSILRQYEIHILPIVNPDGYIYSHNTDRMWRKNRRTNTGSTCIGVDLNRNYGYQWLTGGSSTNPCSDTYAGATADSEPETKAVEAAINAKLGNWHSFITIHSYGLWWFTNWGYTTGLPTDYNNLLAKANVGAAAFTRVNNLKLTVGSSAQILYIASGGSEDWAKGTAGIKYAYCLELRPGQSGVDSTFGFRLPEDRAPAAGRETYAGIKAHLVDLLTNY